MRLYALRRYCEGLLLRCPRRIIWKRAGSWHTDQGRSLSGLDAAGRISLLYRFIPLLQAISHRSGRRPSHGGRDGPLLNALWIRLGGFLLVRRFSLRLLLLVRRILFCGLLRFRSFCPLDRRLTRVGEYFKRE